VFQQEPETVLRYAEKSDEDVLIMKNNSELIKWIEKGRVKEEGEDKI
jgi:hypothetical protein